MKLRIVILYCALLFTAPLSARSNSDMIIMKNGDRLTGQVKGLDSGVLHVSFDYMLGIISLDWSKVDRRESKQLFIAKTDDGAVYTGALRMETSVGRPTQLRVYEAPEQKVVLERSQIVHMNQISDRFWQRFNGQINSGIIFSKANQSTQYTLGSLVEYPRKR